MSEGRLILTRKPYETVRMRVTQSIPVGTIIIVGAMEIGRGEVRLSFQAPKDIEILRGELVDKLIYQAAA